MDDAEHNRDHLYDVRLRLAVSMKQPLKALWGYLAGLAGSLGLAVVVAEIVCRMDLLPCRVAMIAVIVSALLLFTLVYGVSILLETAAEEVPEGMGRRVRRLQTGLWWLVGFLGLVAAVSIPFLWWGVIKQLARSANRASGAP